MKNKKEKAVIYEVFYALSLTGEIIYILRNQIRLTSELVLKLLQGLVREPGFERVASTSIAFICIALNK